MLRLESSVSAFAWCAALVVLASCDQAPSGEHEGAPTAMPAPRGFVRGSVAVDDDHACAIEASGKVACWGRGGAGRLGTPGGADGWQAIEVPGIDDAVEVVAGEHLTCALTARGTVLCWGHDLGPPPQRVAGLDDAIQVVVESDMACGLRATGRVTCWSGDEDKPLVPPQPKEVAGLADVVEIAGVNSGGAIHLCARLKSGTVTCGNSVHPFEPIPSLAGATSLAGAGGRFAVLLPGHRVARWVGWTGYPMPEFLDGVDGERVILGGHLNGNDELCVLGATSRCWMWGGEPGLALSDPYSLPAGTRDLALDTEATCARIADHVECWGRVGRLGDGSSEYTPAFVAVNGITDARQLDAAGRTMCVLRDNGGVACWGERLRATDEKPAHAIDREPVELPGGVNDAVEIAMESGDPGDGSTHIAVAVCARRKSGATCWSVKHGVIEAADAPELATAVKLYSGPAICGVSADGAVRCLRLDDSENYIPGFSEDDYEKIVYQDRAHEGVRRITRVLEKRLHAALAAKRQPVGFHSADARDSGDVIEPDRRLPHEWPRAPVDTLTGAGELRRFEWDLGWDIRRVRAVRCARHDGTVACWGERDYLGAGQRSTHTDPVTVAHVVMGPPRHVTPH